MTVMSIKFKPMLSAKLEVGQENLITWPKLLSPKIDGIRATVQNGVLVSRKLIPIPNDYLRNRWSQPEFELLDGEICFGNPWDPGLFNKTQSAVMSRFGVPDCHWHIFDAYSPEHPFEVRLAAASIIAKKYWEYNLVPVQHHEIDSLEDLLTVEGLYVSQGYEGVMLRKPGGSYKQGRSTLNEQGLIKIKRFDDAEAIIIGVTEQMENTNAPTTNELGKSKRSSHKSGMSAKNTLGAFIVTCDSFGDSFNVGTGIGLTQDLRQQLWDNRDALLGRIIKFKYQKCGTKDAPRMPVFLGFRDGGE